MAIANVFEVLVIVLVVCLAVRLKGGEPPVKDFQKLIPDPSNAYLPVFQLMLTLLIMLPVAGVFLSEGVWGWREVGDSNKLRYV